MKKGFILAGLWLSAALAQKVVGVYTLTPTPLPALNPYLLPQELSLAQAAGFPRLDLPSLGSGLYPLGDNRFLGLTDRGPNLDCARGSGKVFPVPRFTPSLVYFRLEGREAWVERSLPLYTPKGRPVTGLPNRPQDDLPFLDTSCTARLAYDPNGLDPEDVVVLPENRGYLLVEEYAPSLVYVDPEGVVRARFVPKGVRLEADYPVKEALPGILAQRRNNRGLENLALSSDGKTAWAILQSPIGSTKDPAFDGSLVARAVRLDVSDPLNVRATGMYLVPFSDPKDYPKPNRPRDMKYSAAFWVKEETLLLLERAEGGARIYLVDFKGATNLLERPDGESPELDKAGTDYARLGIRLPERRLLLETWKFKEFDTDKLEGIALLEDGKTLAIIADNDFAVTEDKPTKLWLVELPERLR
jgi:hypothetical protein